jgi:hypothetical protein
VSSNQRPSSQNRLILGLWGIPLGLMLYVVAIEVVIASAPRYSQGVRECVDLPWPVFAVLPYVVAILLVYLVSLFTTRCWKLRVLVLCAAVLTILLCSPVGIGLLRRDFIGKL